MSALTAAVTGQLSPAHAAAFQTLAAAAVRGGAYQHMSVRSTVRPRPPLPPFHAIAHDVSHEGGVPSSQGRCSFQSVWRAAVSWRKRLSCLRLTASRAVRLGRAPRSTSHATHWRPRTASRPAGLAGGDGQARTLPCRCCVSAFGVFAEVCDMHTKVCLLSGLLVHRARCTCAEACNLSFTSGGQGVVIDNSVFCAL